MNNHHYEEETLSSRKRTNLTHFLQGLPPALKRKRSFHSENNESAEDQVQQPPKKKKNTTTTTTLNRVTAIIQKIVSVVHTSPIKRYSAKWKNKRDDAFTLYQDYFITLPTIEWTNGSLGIVVDTTTTSTVTKIEEAEEIDDDEESIYLEFPTPPSLSPKLLAQQITPLTTTIIKKKKRRLDSCPPRFDSLITHGSDCSDGSMLPLTPISTTSSDGSSSDSSSSLQY